MTKGSAWKIGKGCFGGSLSGKEKVIIRRFRYNPLISGSITKGTVGRKLSKRIL